MFWLDGHYSGEGTAKGDKETPILEELKCILNKNDYKHVILIDDARLFGNVCDYPSIDELNKFIISKDLDIDLVVDNDIIKLHLSSSWSLSLILYFHLVSILNGSLKRIIQF